MLLLRTQSTLRLGLKSIRVHPLRSSLTVMGIILGVASVILMLAIGEAARFQAIQQIKDLGATNIIVRSVKPTEEDKRQNNRQFILNYGLTLADMDRIALTIPTVSSVTPMRKSPRAAIRLSAQHSSTQPPAIAWPLTAATTGFGKKNTV